MFNERQNVNIIINKNITIHFGIIANTLSEHRNTILFKTGVVPAIPGLMETKD